MEGRQYLGLFGQKVEDAWQRFQIDHTEERRPNVLVLGASGAGKSGLVHAVLGADARPAASVIDGRLSWYRGADSARPLNLIEAPACLETIRKIVRDGTDFGAVHAVWYCLPATEGCAGADSGILEQLLNDPEIRRRLLVVLTKCDCDADAGAAVVAQMRKQDRGSALPVYRTSAQPDLPLSLPQLLKRSAQLFDDADLRRSFIQEQMMELDAQHAASRKVIGAASAAAAAIGAVPLPFSDAALLVPTQMAMMSKITDLYGIRDLAVVSRTVVSNVVVSQIGRSLASGLLKLIPVVGAWVGGAVSAGVASALTFAIGTAASELCFANLKRVLGGEKVVWDQIFASPEFLEAVRLLFSGRLSRPAAAGGHTPAWPARPEEAPDDASRKGN